MGQFIVSARKYRPNNFESLIGQENIAKTLKNSILRRQLAHAYLFCGPRGVGKTSAARIFAKTINCSNPTEDMEPCGCCESCRSFTEGRSYSIHELDAASNNSVDDIRSLTDQVRIPPQIGSYSVYIIDEVHMLSQAAFNAFLKTLEEPPAHAIFILATTEKHKILPTILSRCQTYDFNRIGVDNIVSHLKDIASKENVDISDDALHILAQKADGAMRDALTLFDQTVAFCGNSITYEQVIRNLNVLDYEYYFKLTDCFLTGDFAEALLTFDAILSRGFNAGHFIAGLSSHFRDLIVCKNEASQTLLELAPGIAAKYREYAEKCTVAFLFEALSCSTGCEASYRSSSNPRLLIEFTLMKICRIAQSPQTIGVAAPTSKAYSTAAPGADKSYSSPSSRAAATGQAAGTGAAVNGPSDNGQLSSPGGSAQSSQWSPQTQPQNKTQGGSNSMRMAGLSIKDMMKQQESVSASSPAADRNEPGRMCREFTEENISQVWHLLAASESKSPRLASAIDSTVPILDKREKALHFMVGNTAQKEWIDRACRARLEAFIQAQMGDRSIRLFIDVKEAAAEGNRQNLYMPSDRANYLQQNSPEFRLIRKDFELEVK